MSCYVFYNFDKIQKKKFVSIWTKNDACEDILQKHVKKRVKKPKKKAEI